MRHHFTLILLCLPPVVIACGCSSFDSTQSRSVLSGGVATIGSSQPRTFKSLKAVREEKGFEKTTMHVEDVLRIEKYAPDKLNPTQRNRNETQIAMREVAELSVEAIRSDDHKRFYDQRWANIDRGNNFAYFDPAPTYPAIVTVKFVSGETESFRVESLILGVNWSNEASVEFFRFWPESEHVTFSSTK